MPSNDVIQLTTRGLLFGQQVLNVFFYKQINDDDTPRDNVALLTDFLDVVWVYWKVVVSDEYTQPEIALSQVMPPGSEHVESGLTSAGLVSGDCLPPHVAFAYQLNRSNKTTYHGKKRFAGVPESSQADGVAVSGVLTALNNLEGALALTITDGAGVYAPVIVSKWLNGMPRDPWLTNQVLNASYKGISSQNTRKFGRGT